MSVEVMHLAMLILDVYKRQALEAKTVGASSGFMKQISSMLSRAGESNVKSISMSIEGAAEFDIKPNRLIINTKSLDQVAVTTMNKRQLELANKMCIRDRY